MQDLKPSNRPLATGARSLAREMAEAHGRLIDWYTTHHDDHAKSALEAFLNPETADADAHERVASAPGEELTWTDLDRVARIDYDQMVEAWQRACSEAREEFESGHRAARVLEVVGSPWSRAQFLTLREAFREEWQPRGGIEDSMIDTLAQAYTQYEFWLTMSTERSSAMSDQQRQRVRKYSTWSPPEQDAADAVEQAGAMVERFHRLYLRTLRAMRDYRRYNGPVVVQSAGQVNVGGQQVNVVH